MTEACALAISSELSSQQQRVGITKIVSPSTPKVQPATRESRARSHVDTNDNQRLSYRDGEAKKVVSQANGPQEEGTSWCVCFEVRAEDCC